MGAVWCDDSVLVALVVLVVLVVVHLTPTREGCVVEKQKKKQQHIEKERKERKEQGWRGRKRDATKASRALRGLRLSIHTSIVYKEYTEMPYLQYSDPNIWLYNHCPF